MKTNEAPEKIYVDSKAIGDNISTTVRTLPQDYPTCTEYIRTDTFIEKACNKLAQLMYDQHLFEGRLHQDAIIENFVGDFENYMKGE